MLLASPIDELRHAVLVELRRCVQVFRALGARWMNVHPSLTPLRGRATAVAKMVESLENILGYARQCGVGVMVENAPGQFNDARQLGDLLDPLPELGLHLDVGHTNLMTPVDTTPEILAAYGPRVQHVHCNDNNGGSLDLHPPLGVGAIDLPQTIRALKSSGYDGTITLEVFAPDRPYLLYSRDVLRKLWDAAQASCRGKGPLSGVISTKTIPPLLGGPIAMRKPAKTVAQPPQGASLADLAKAAKDCKACEVWKTATQTFGEKGGPHPRLMLIGEQPGNFEDLAGSPFVGPAGKPLDDAWVDASAALAPQRAPPAGCLPWQFGGKSGQCLIPRSSSADRRVEK